MNMKKTQMVWCAALVLTLTSLLLPTHFASAAILNAAPNNLGLVGYWTMDASQTNWNTGKEIDSSGSGNTGSLNGLSTTTSPAVGVRGQAMTFPDATGSNISVPDSASLQVEATGSFTLSAWVYMTTVQFQTIMFKAATSFASGGWSLAIDRTANDIDLAKDGVADQTLTVPFTWQPNTWYHVVAVQVPGTVTYYINGVSIGSVSNASGYQSSSGKTLFIGGGVTGSFAGTNFLGRLDDVRVYNRALTATDTRQLYNAGPVNIDVSPTTAVSNGLVGYWTFDGKNINWATGQAFDSSGLGNTSSLISMSTTTTPVIGKIGQALNFNGTSQYLTLPTSFQGLSGPVTFSAWVYPTALQDGEIIACNNSLLEKWQLRMDRGGDGVFSFAADRGDQGRAVSTQTVSSSLNTWVMVTGTNDGTTNKIYINGVLQGSFAHSGANGTCSGIPAIGDDPVPGNGNPYFAGKIDDVRIYNRALSAQEVQQLYLQGGGGQIDHTNIPFPINNTVTLVYATSTTWTKPAGLTSVTVQVWGGGGGGTDASAGGNGANSSFTFNSGGSVVTANGGTGASGSTAGTGGSASGGDINITGGNGAGGGTGTGGTGANWGLVTGGASEFAGGVGTGAGGGGTGAGGGAGGYLSKSILAANLGSTETITVGGGGGGGTSGLTIGAGGNGGNGSTSGYGGGGGGGGLGGGCGGGAGSAGANGGTTVGGTGGTNGSGTVGGTGGSNSGGAGGMGGGDSNAGIAPNSASGGGGGASGCNFIGSYVTGGGGGGGGNGLSSGGAGGTSSNAASYGGGGGAGGAVIITENFGVANTQGLVGYWTFDQKTTNWNTGQELDSSGNGNILSLSSMSITTSPIAGKIGQGMFFNGINNNMGTTTFSSNIPAGASPRTVALWMRPTTALLNGEAPFMYGLQSASDGFYFVVFSNGELCVGQWGGGDSPCTSAGAIAINAWYDIVETYDGTTAFLYVNGLLIGSTARSFSTTPVGLTVGSAAGNVGFFQGIIDDVRVYNRALSATQVLQLYNAGR